MRLGVFARAQQDDADAVEPGDDVELLAERDDGTESESADAAGDQAEA